MARICREVDDWIQTQVEQPVESWATRTETQCAAQPCNWWCLCCNKWFCWLVTLVVRIVTFVLVTITRLVTRVVCEVVALVADFGAFLVNLVLSIPIIGGIIRTVVNWLTEIFWRIAGAPDFFLTLAGIQIPKKMYVKMIILNNNGVPVTTEAAVLPAIQMAQSIFRTQCNINLIYTGACVPKTPSPGEALTVSCDAGGFFADWWVAGSYFEFVTAGCAIEDGARRVSGYGAELIAFLISDVVPNSPANTIGCSFAATHNYIVEEAADPSAIAHELAHACGLWHVSDVNNLMNPSVTATSLTLDTWQRAIVRNSRHCVFV